MTVSELLKLILQYGINGFALLATITMIFAYIYQFKFLKTIRDTSILLFLIFAFFLGLQRLPF